MLFLASFIAAENANAQLTFEPLVVSSNRLQLVLLGNTGSAYAIEKSSNLANWTTLFSSIASNGRVEFSGTLTADPAQFFRGRPDVAPISITPKSNPEHTSKLFATMQGGSTVLEGTNGTRFTLTFPSNNIVTPTTLTMTLVTNISGLPFSGGLIGAVQIGPDDPELYGGGELSVTFPTNIDRRKIASFTANSDGSNLALTPDRVFTNRVAIPITHSGLFGVALATTQEIEQVSQSVSASTAAFFAGKKSNLQIAQQPLPTSVLCFPQHVAEAARIRSEIRKALRAAQSDIAAILEIERQRQLVGIESDTSDIFEQVGPMSCDFYNSFIAPHWPEAAVNCSLNKVLLEASLGLERQMQMLGVPDGERCTAQVLSAGTLCPGFKGCLKEIETCCLGGHQERQRLIDLITLVRQQSLLGIEHNSALGCFDLNDNITQGVIDVCTKSKWNGTISTEETGDAFEHISDVTGYTETTESYDVSFGGVVTNATEQIIPGLGLMATLNIAGQGTGRNFHELYSQTQSKCGISFSRDKSESGGSAVAIYGATLTIQATNYNVSIVFFSFGDQQENFYPAERRTERSSLYVGGIGCLESTRTHSTSTSPDTFLLPSLPVFSGPIGGDTNVISGSTNYTGYIGSMETTITIKWDFQRSKVAQ
ncbi:MAG TPA: hypothetical protein VMZ26_00555 [Pyrinomonadaceae bacterium]|nr:hypothetical protein [Pyrinomonadaceae bacterium]